MCIVGAVRLDGVVCHQSFQGSMNTERFVSFIRDRLCPRLRVGDVLVMDNLRPHHASEVRALVEARSASLLYLPPYSPELNPIEPCWAFAKNIVRKDRPRTPVAIRESLRRAMLRVRRLHLRGWFAHCGYNPRT